MWASVPPTLVVSQARGSSHVRPLTDLGEQVESFKDSSVPNLKNRNMTQSLSSESQGQIIFLTGRNHSTSH